MATCPQCTAKTKAGGRCKRTTCRYAPFCAAHRAFTIDESTLPGAGKGIFASRPLKRSGTIGDYTIATIKQNETEFLESYPDSRATHTAKINDSYFTALGTGKRTHNGIGMGNRAASGRRNNAKILKSGRVVATRRMGLEDEFFIAYGRGYKI